MPPEPIRGPDRTLEVDEFVPGARLSGRSAAIVASYGLAVLLVQFGTPWALTFHEVNFAEPAREFLRTGDWLVPRLAGRPLWDKPPLMHWSIAASVSAFGTEAEWAARLPANLSAVAVALTVASLSARWLGDRVGLLAGLVQMTCIYTLMQARLAEADMPLCAAVTVAMASLARGAAGRLPGDRVPIGWTLAFFGASGVAFLAKGPIGPALIAAGAGLFAIVERRRAPWRLLLDPFGWALLLILILAWADRGDRPGARTPRGLVAAQRRTLRWRPGRRRSRARVLPLHRRLARPAVDAGRPRRIGRRHPIEAGAGPVLEAARLLAPGRIGPADALGLEA